MAKGHPHDFFKAWELSFISGKTRKQSRYFSGKKSD